MERPNRTTPRLVSLDVVRSLALFGVLAVNLDTEFRVSSFERFLAPALAGSSADRLASQFLAAVVGTKPLILFSLLFGVGLAAQAEGASRSTSTSTPTPTPTPTSTSTSTSTSTLARTLRRLFVLFVLGALHFVLLWSGDVLALYAVVAVAAALLLTLLSRLSLPSRVLLLIALSLFGLALAPVPFPTPFASAEEMHAHVEAARQIYAHGTYGDVLRFRLREALPALALLLWSAPRTLGLFLLGAYAWRAGFFSRADARPRLVKVALTTFVVGVATVLAVHGVGLLGPWPGALLEWSELLLAFAAGSAIVLAVDAPIVGPLLARLAPLGRMTLTSYLIQSFILGIVFYGYGLGLFGRVGSASGLALSAGIFCVQALFAAVWLRRFRFGPVERLWRALALRGATSRDS